MDSYTTPYHTRTYVSYGILSHATFKLNSRHSKRKSTQLNLCDGLRLTRTPLDGNICALFGYIIHISNNMCTEIRARLLGSDWFRCCTLSSVARSLLLRMLFCRRFSVVLYYVVHLAHTSHMHVS